MSDDGNVTPDPGHGPGPGPWSPGSGAPEPPAPSGYEAVPPAPFPTAPYPAVSGAPASGLPDAPQAPVAPVPDPYAAPTPGASVPPPVPAAATYPPPGYPQPTWPTGPGGPTAPGVPVEGPAGQPGYPQPPFGAGPYPQGQYAPPPTRGTDGVSIAALVTGLLGLGVVPLVLGIVGLGRTKRNGTQGRGLSIAGIVLGALEIVGWIIAAIVIAYGISQFNGRIDTLHAECAAGDMASCDRLYQESLPDSAEEEFGRTCGGQTDGYGSCEYVTGLDGSADGASTYGDDPELDALWDSCAAGDAAACDDLYLSSPWGSEYEEFGGTCGGQTSGDVLCDSGTTAQEGQAYGDDPELDALWDACQGGSGAACDDLYWDSPAGSEYEDFGTTCGGRVESAISCESEIGA